MEIKLEFGGYKLEGGIPRLPTQSGIYCIYSCLFNKEADTVSLKKLLYIGESQDVNDRIKNHEKWKKWESKLSGNQEICISYALVSSSKRLRAEAALIYNHKPPVNTEYIDSFPFDDTYITTSGKNEFLEEDFTVERAD